MALKGYLTVLALTTVGQKSKVRPVNTLSATVTVAAFLALGASVALMVVGYRWEKRSREALAQLAAPASAPSAPVDRQLWDGETWDALRNDPRVLDN